MELFNLVAKLTLDSSEYESAIHQAESDASGLDDVEANLTLNDDDFETDMAQAEAANVTPKEAELTLDDSDFDTDMTEAEGRADPDKDAELTLDDDDFDTDMADAEGRAAPDKDATLSIDTNPYTDGLVEAEAQTGTFESSVESIFDGIGNYIAAAGVATAIAGIVSSLTEAVDLARSIGDNIDKSSRAMSMSTDAYQEWSHVLDINGASITDLNRGLMNMRKLTQGGKVTDEVTEGFTKLGLSFKVASGEISTTEELLEATLKALADYEGEDRDVIAQAIFGRGGTKLNALFDGTSQDIEDLKKQAHDLGLVMSEESVANAAAYNDAVTNMNASIESFRIAIVEQILPSLTEVFNKVASIVAFFNPRNSKNALSEQFKDTDAELAENLVDIEATSGAAEKMIEKLFSMGEATKLTAEQQAEWKGTAEWLKENIPSLSEVIDTDTLSISANKDEVIALTKEWKNYAIERAKADALKDKQKALAERTKEWLEAEAEAVRLEGEATKQQEKVNALLKRDFEAMPENAQNKFLGMFGYGGLEDIDWASGSKIYNQLKNALGSSYQEWGLSGYGSKELSDAISELEGNMSSFDTQIAEAKEKADALKEEVENGRTELAEYSATLDTVIGNLGGTGEQADGAKESVDGLNEALGKLPNAKTIAIDVLTNFFGSDLFHQAKGNWDVPYDNYPSLLHRGERVLTASQARQMDSGTIGSMDFSGMYDIVKDAIRAGMSDVSVNSYLNERNVTDDINRVTGRQLKARRFRG